MCGRFTLRTNPERIAEALGSPLVGRVRERQLELGLRFNIAPTQDVLTLFRPTPPAPPEWTHMRWGIRPAWSREEASTSLLFNARSETVAEKPAFRAAFRSRRCVFAADGFYEWQAAGKSKRPWFIRLVDDAPFAAAGIWETAVGPDGGAIVTAALLTTSPNAVMAPLHDRMPVILPPDALARWLDPAADAETLRSLLVPFPAERMIASPVSARVNSARHEGPACLAPSPVRELF